MKPNISVLDYRLHPEARDQIQLLASNQVTFPEVRCPEDERIERTGDSDIVLVTPWERIDAAYLEACPNLRYVGLCGTSTANVDLDELDRRGIAFSNIVSGDKESVAEFFFMELVRLARGAGEYQWKPGEEHELVGRSMGIIGMGEVGKAMAHMALAYKMQVSYTSPHRKDDWEAKGVDYKEMDQLLSENEIIIICSPTNVEVLNADRFNKMRAGSILVQASSGTPFAFEAFREWISQEGNFALFDMSAGPKNYQLYKGLARVIFSEKVAGDTFESNQRRGTRAVDNLREFLEQS